MLVTSDFNDCGFAARCAERLCLSEGVGLSEEAVPQSHWRRSLEVSNRAFRKGSAFRTSEGMAPKSLQKVHINSRFAVGNHDRPYGCLIKLNRSGAANDAINVTKLA